MAKGRVRPVFVRGVPLKQGLLLSLPESRRERLASPFGEVFEGRDLKARLRDSSSFAAVGDVCAGEAIRQGLAPRFIVVDFKTKRGPIPPDDAVRSYGTRVARVACPPGHLTSELYNAIVVAVAVSKPALAQPKTTRIEVDGEEDLAVMPAIIHLEEGTTVIYGLPDRGVTLVKVDDESSRVAREFLESFEVVPS